jgi:transcriptional regulator with GAF, ATPase, and Fis domain
MLRDDNRYLSRELQRISGNRIIGADFGLRQVMEMARLVAPRDSPVLLSGETGVGKDVLANAIHELSTRRDGPFIKVNCGAIPDTLIDSELFGHEKGAFSGAIVQKRGRFERADGGTIFLDEIGDLPLPAQVRLLRVLQSREIERVGGTQVITVDIRVIAATNRDLQEMVKKGTFREDLWFRLNVFPIIIPPLRERKKDIPSLVRHFIEKKSRELRLMSQPTLAVDAFERLAHYDWPGNVRELENVVERALILWREGPLVLDPFVETPQPTEPLQTSVEVPSFLRLNDVLAWHFRRVLEMTKGRVHGPDGAAAILGINPGTLRHRMNKLGIPYGRKWKSAST